MIEREAERHNNNSTLNEHKNYEATTLLSKCRGFIKTLLDIYLKLL